MSCRLNKKSPAAMLIAAVAALGTMAMYAQRATADDAEDASQQEGRIVEISPDGEHTRITRDQSLIAEDEAAAARPAFWLGIQGQPLSSDVLRTHLQLAEGVGVVVEQVVPGSPAEKAGVRKHDVLLAVDGEQISDMTVLQQAVAASEGKPIELKVIRLAKEMKLEVTPEATPADLDIAAAPGANVGGMLRGQGMPMDEIQAMLQQMQQNGVAGGMRVLGPGMIVNGQGLDLQHMPQNVQVTITREGDGPAKVMVKRGDESWTLEDGDQEALAKLPDDVRPFVEQMLQSGQNGVGILHRFSGGDAAHAGLPGQLGAFNFHFDGSELDAARQQAGAAAEAAADAAVQGAQELNQGLIQRLEDLEQHLQRLEQQLQEKSDEGGHGSSDPTKS